MRLKKARQVLKSFADDTRLRIVQLLSRREMNVSELCGVLGVRQPTLSKHLTRLRLVGVVSDRREGLSVYYRLVRSEDRAYQALLDAVTVGLWGVEEFRRDGARLNSLRRSQKGSIRKRGRQR